MTQGGDLTVRQATPEERAGWARAATEQKRQARAREHEACGVRGAEPRQPCVPGRRSERLLHRGQRALRRESSRP